MIDEYERAEMAQLILREKDAAEALDEAREALALWVKRGKMAVKAGRKALALEAKKRALEARNDLLAAEKELEHLKWTKRRVRKVARRPDDMPTTRAELLVEQFRMQGLAPEDQELEEISDREEARLQIEAMQAQQGGGPAAAASEMPAPSSEIAAAGAEVEPPAVHVDGPVAGAEAVSDSETAAPAAESAPAEAGAAPAPARRKPPSAEALSTVEKELAALKSAMGGSAPPTDDEALAELERALSRDDEAP